MAKCLFHASVLWILRVLGVHACVPATQTWLGAQGLGVLLGGVGLAGLAAGPVCAEQSAVLSVFVCEHVRVVALAHMVGGPVINYT